jgi:hypothetical protein
MLAAQEFTWLSSLKQEKSSSCPRSKQGNFGVTMDMLPFYAYLNQLVRRAVTPKEGDETKIMAYNKNILAAMAPNAPMDLSSQFLILYGRK